MITQETKRVYFVSCSIRTLWFLYDYAIDSNTVYSPLGLAISELSHPLVFVYPSIAQPLHAGISIIQLERSLVEFLREIPGQGQEGKAQGISLSDMTEHARPTHPFFVRTHTVSWQTIPPPPPSSSPSLFHPEYTTLLVLVIALSQNTHPYCFLIYK